MESDIFSWLKFPIHKNTLKHLEFKWEEDPAIMETLKMTFEGSIIAVLTKSVERYLSDNQILMRRIGFEKMPKSFKITNADEFYSYLAHNVEVSEE
jgi:hypothetical protein